jgi:uncharacterized RDD family membrane protein YckC
MSHRYPVAVPRPHGFLLASVGARFMARLVDVLVVLVLASVANIWLANEFWRNVQPVMTWLMTQPTTMETIPATAERAFEMLTVMALVLTAVWFAYEVPASANSGQTLGKRIFAIRIVREETDDRLGFGRSFRRWFRMAWPTPFWVACCGVSALWQIVDCLFVVTDRRNHQALHDRITRTLVVQVPRAGRPSNARGAETEDAVSEPRRAAENTVGGPGADPR